MVIKVYLSNRKYYNYIPSLNNRIYYSYYRIHYSTFEQLAATIVEIFPIEDKIIYYERGYFINETGSTKRRINTGGLLYLQYSHERDFYRKIGLITPASVKASKKTVATLGR